MFRRAREIGPSMLVPLAWTVVIAAHVDVVADRTLFIAHVVMTVLLAVFAVTGRADMREGVLAVWWRLIAVGFLVTLCGTVGFRAGTAGRFMQGVALAGWMLLPAVGFVDTGRRVDDGRWIYLGGAVGCLAGAVLYAVGLFGGVAAAVPAGLVLVGVGQTAGILDAVVRY